MKVGPNAVTVEPNEIRRIAELLDYLSDLAEYAEPSLDGAEATELIEERIGARKIAASLRARTYPSDQPSGSR